MKRLYKNDQNKVIGGVCAGIAEYFGIDPSIVRVVWAILFFIYSFGFWIYIIAWVILPPKSQIMFEERRQREQEQKRRDDLGFDTSDAKEGEIVSPPKAARHYSDDDYNEDEYYKESLKNEQDR